MELKSAEDGEVLCKGHNVMLGYYKDPKLTKEAFDDEGWFRTGDVGHLEDGKFLKITDRKKEIFKLSSGKFVAPQPIENRMKESSFIDQVMVVGEHEKFASALLVPDFKYLKEWCAARELKPGNSPDDIISLPEVIAAYNEEVAKINKGLSEWERISRFKIVSDEWSPASGELSASLKLKRKTVLDKYPELLDSIYRKQA